MEPEFVKPWTERKPAHNMVLPKPLSEPTKCKEHQDYYI